VKLPSPIGIPRQRGGWGSERTSVEKRSVGAGMTTTFAVRGWTDVASGLGAPSAALRADGNLARGHSLYQFTS
jgi:hypothetical protein